MNHNRQKLAWILVLALLFISIVPLGATASDGPTTITLDTTTDADYYPGGGGVTVYINYQQYVQINYFASASSDTVLATQEANLMWGSVNLLTHVETLQPYAWHIVYQSTDSNFAGCGYDHKDVFRAYPITSLENLPEDVTDAGVFPEGTVLSASHMTIEYLLGETPVKTGITADESYTLPSIAEFKSLVGEDALQDFIFPDVTNEFSYSVNYTKDGENFYVKLTLTPSVEITFDSSTGTPDLSTTKCYATPYATVDMAKLPVVSLDGVDFAYWKNGSALYKLSDKCSFDQDMTLTAMYIEKVPTFTLNYETKMIQGLLPNRTYKTGWVNYNADADGQLSFDPDVNSLLGRWEMFYLVSSNPDIILDSDYVYMRYDKPQTMPVFLTKPTSVTVTNTSAYPGCEYSLDNATYQDSPQFTGLTPETEYTIYIRHKQDEHGFVSDARNDQVTTAVAKAVSDEQPNGITIEAIATQIYKGIAVEPAPVIKDGTELLTAGTDYTLAYTDSDKTGTATINITFNNDYSGTMTAQYEIASVESVGVTPADVTLVMNNGATQTFSATVTGTNNPPESVTWSVSGQSSEQTVIDASGVLTVGTDETATALTVKATSTADTDKSGTQTVTLHTHAWATAWSSDATSHWHECDNADTCPVSENSSKEGYAPHEYDNICDTTCNVCGATRDITPHQHTEVRNYKAATTTEEGYTGDTFCLDCGALVAPGESIPMLTPSIVSGADTTITSGSTESLVIASNAAPSDFVKLTMDSVDVSEENYTLGTGSLTVTIKPEYLATLTTGQHTVAIVSSAGAASTTFTILEAPTTPTTEATQTSETTETTETADTTPATQTSATAAIPATGNNSSNVLFAVLTVLGMSAVVSMLYKSKKPSGNQL